MIRIGIIGKTNTGKTTFFNAATSSTGEVSTYPFTTKKPSTATGQVQTLCVCRELDVTDKPRNSTCIDGWRFIPIEIIDLPGLIKGAFEENGLGLFRKEFREAPRRIQITTSHTRLQRGRSCAKEG